MNKDKIIKDLKERNDKLENQRRQFELNYYHEQHIVEEKDKEIERLNNIIDKLEKELEFEINDYNGNIDLETRNIDSEFLRGNAWEADYLLNKLKKLKEGK